jgi:hypothetical protein
MNTRSSRYAAVLLAFVAVASPGQTFASDGDGLFEPDIRQLRLPPELAEDLMKARKEAREGVLWRFFVSPGKHTVKLFSKDYWPESMEIDIKEGESKDLWIGMQDRVHERITQYPAAREAHSVPADGRGGDRPEWTKTLLVTSVVGLGVSLGVGLTGLMVYNVSSAESEKITRHAGVGMVVGGAIGLGFSVIGIGVSLASTPPGPTIIYQGSNPEPPKPSALVLAPHVGRNYVGIAVRGTF